MKLTDIARRLAAIAIFVVSLTEWSGILSPPIKYLSENSLFDLARELLRVNNEVYGPTEPYNGILFLVLTLIVFIGVITLSRGALRYYDDSFIKISILETELKLDFLAVDMSIARLSRNQLFHANRSGIFAYKFVSTLDSADGEIDTNSIRMSSTLNNRRITLTPLHIFGNRKKVEVFESYNNQLPTNIFASLYPNWLTRLIYKAGLFQSLIVNRNGDVIYRNEYNGKAGVMSAYSLYTTASIIMTIKFFEETAPDDDHVSCHLVNESIVENLGYTVSHDGPYRIYSVKAFNIKSEQIRFQWDNVNLENYVKTFVLQKNMLG